MIGVVIILCVCLHINLSPADIKSSVRALPVYTVFTLVLALIVFLVGGAFADGYVSALTTWVFLIPALYMIVFSFAIALILFSLVVYALGRIFARK